MAKADLGTKRLCPNCGAKYYDLNRDPIICPRCDTVFEVPTKSRGHAAPAPAEEEEAVEAPESETAEFVSLEEADEEAAGGAVEEDEDIEIGDDEKDTFLEEEDEEGEDVADIIGEVEDEEP